MAVFACQNVFLNFIELSCSFMFSSGLRKYILGVDRFRNYGHYKI